MQASALCDYLSVLPATHRAVLVTHMVKITALTGEAPAVGEALVGKTGGSGASAVLSWIQVA